MSGPPLHLALIGATAAVVLLPMAFRVSRRRFDVFEPIVLFAIVYGVMFVARPAAAVFNDELIYQAPRSTLDVSDAFAMMLLVSFLGAVGFCIGYMLPIGKKMGRIFKGSSERLDFRRVFVAAASLAGAGIVSFLIFVGSTGGLATLSLFFQGRSSGLTEAIGAASMYPWAGSLVLVPAAVISVALASQLRTTWAFGVAAFSVTLVLLRFVPTGNRFLLLVFFGGLLVFYYLRRDARPSAIALSAVLVIALTASVLVSDLRGRGERGETVMATAVNLVSTPSRIFAPLVSGPDSEMALTLAAALDEIREERSLTYGQTILGDLAVRPVPRPLWDTKPEPPRRQLIADIWPLEYSAGAFNPEFSALLYFYWDFWFVGVVMGLAIYGVLARSMYEYMVRNRSDIGVQVIYALSLWFVVIALRHGPVDSLITGVFVLLPAWVIFRFAGRAQRTHSHQRDLVLESSKVA